MNSPQALLSAMGRKTDTDMAHVTPGEAIIPREVLQDPKMLGAFSKAMQERGMNFLDFVVGPGSKRNPNTGFMEAHKATKEKHWSKRQMQMKNQGH